MNFHEESNLKSTSIGEIPKDWKEVTLEDVTLSHKQGFYTDESYSEKGVRLVRITDLLNPEISYETMPFLSVDDRTYEQFKVTVGDFLFARSGAIGRHGVVTKDVPCIFASYIIRFRFDRERVDNNFLSQLFQAAFVKRQFLSKKHGATNININAENIKSIKIPLPLIGEQKAIVGVLGVVDSAIELADRVIAKTERLKKGLMEKLLTEGIGHKEFKDTEIGRMPKEWQVFRLGDSSIAEIVLGQSPPSSTYNSEGIGLPFLQGKMEFGEIYPSPTSFCSEPSKVAETNDILLSVRAPVGAVNIAQDRYCIGRGLSTIKTKKEKLSHLFLFYYLCSAERRFSSLSMGSTFKAIRKDEIEKFSVPLPTLKEQQAIAEMLSTVDSKSELERREKTRLKRIKQGLMDLLLTGKVRIKVD